MRPPLPCTIDLGSPVVPLEKTIKAGLAKSSGSKRCGGTLAPGPVLRPEEATYSVYDVAAVRAVHLNGLAEDVLRKTTTSTSGRRSAISSTRATRSTRLPA
jgi:hypothetical protein